MFCNPPYGRDIAKWVEKAYNETRRPNTKVVMLIPARTDTSYWHKWIFPHATHIDFVRGRIKFGNSKNSAPFPSAVVEFASQIVSVNIAEEIKHLDRVKRYDNIETI